VWLLERMLFMPYIWGGDDWGGFDCSGMAVEILQAVGTISRSADYSAEGLWQKFHEHRLPEGSTPRAGYLVFWFTEDRATHVEMMADEFSCIGASGGGKPRYNLTKLCAKYPLLLQLCKPGDGTAVNPFAWLLTKMLRLWEADLRNAYIKMNLVGYRGGGYRFADPFKSIK